MIRLQPMQDCEYTLWIQESIKEYAEEKTKAGNFQKETSLEQAENEFNQLLPDGLESKDHYLFTLLDDKNQEDVGTLWINVQEDGKEAFIYDIKIHESKRGKGYGKEALKSLDSFAREKDISKISLHVFGHNKVALSLYQNTGFEVTNVLMSKTL
ncbi:N-acetyltransferase [Rossellomorea aquimaris]|uniref:Acetyltransferase (GNAT) family protein n=1 Tax=Rossellomorea aquimaris TaxID=189382 RepID=A0A366EZZ0_9BACI|nr:GNAT family N-acetyltransferase [Rossellomorea aquimaris]RBP07914.1 acetyltransferase (GNAT) family protein [Rossellomorea aquimaris]